MRITPSQKSTLKILLLGIGVIGWVLFSGVMIMFSRYGLAVLVEAQTINEYQGMIFSYVIMGVFFSLMLYAILSVARTKRCPHCKGVLE